MQLTQPKNVYREDKREGANLFQIVEKEQLKVPAHIDYLGDLRDFVVQVGKKYGYSHKIVNAFKLAIDEAATNIIRHAYRDKDGHIIRHIIGIEIILDINQRGVFQMFRGTDCRLLSVWVTLIKHVVDGFKDHSSTTVQAAIFFFVNCFQLCMK